MVLDFDTLPRIRTLKRNAGRTTQSAARKQLSRNQPKNQIRMPGQKKQQNKRTTQPTVLVVKTENPKQNNRKRNGGVRRVNAQTIIQRIAKPAGMEVVVKNENGGRKTNEKGNRRRRRNRSKKTGNAKNTNSAAQAPNHAQMDQELQNYYEKDDKIMKQNLDNELNAYNESAAAATAAATMPMQQVEQMMPQNQPDNQMQMQMQMQEQVAGNVNAMGELVAN